MVNDTDRPPGGPGRTGVGVLGQEARRRRIPGPPGRGGPLPAISADPHHRVHRGEDSAPPEGESPSAVKRGCTAASRRRRRVMEEVLGTRLVAGVDPFQRDRDAATGHPPGRPSFRKDVSTPAPVWWGGRSLPGQRIPLLSLQFGRLKRGQTECQRVYAGRLEEAVERLTQYHGEVEQEDCRRRAADPIVDLDHPRCADPHSPSLRDRSGTFRRPLRSCEHFPARLADSAGPADARHPVAKRVAPHHLVAVSVIRCRSANRDFGRRH